MSRRQLQAVFDREEDLLDAVHALRARDLSVEDIFTPYPVHGLDEAAGMRPTRIGWVCAIFGLSGAAFALAFQEWVSVISWPLVIGGKPLDSLPAFVPVMFEVGVLSGGLASVFALFWLTRLYPGKKAQLPHPEITDNRFVLVMDASLGGLDLPAVKGLLTEQGASELAEVMAEAEGGAR